MNRTILSLVTALSLVSVSSYADFTGEGYSIKTDVPYGKGVITKNGMVASRDLVMDVVQPDVPIAENNPAIVLAFGGNFIRGDKNQAYSVDGAQTTSMRDYCKRFAQEGYTCVAIDYRLSREEPIVSNIGYSNEVLVDSELRFDALHDRHNMLRVGKGLDPLPKETDIVKNSVIAASEDMFTAVRFLRDNADQYAIDPDRIALGGFSAGAITSFNVAYGMQAPVKAVFGNSGYGLGFDFSSMSQGSQALPPALIHFGHTDLTPLLDAAEPVLENYKAVGVEVETAWVPGFGHFYPAEATSLGEGVSKQSVQERILDFLNRHL
ncbi:alpha/beta hydrolase [Vibrio sonorensis]|uniref:alpha/beta hydrolase n=1 Tax=Vibrio sonorensis TaxID=1004316 RepID=UPI0008D9AA42|nr:alpha/beta hydrolase [Vibrio sonorensis]